MDVLVIEDEAVLGKALQRGLSDSRYSCTWVRNGRKGLDLGLTQRFDAIVLDLLLPDMDGIEATALIREREKHQGGRTPIVALTAHTMKGDRERCLAAGMDNYINKPIDAVKFLEIVELTAAAPSGV